MNDTMNEILEEIKNMWSVDCKVNQGNLANEIANVPLLHSKYISLLTDAKIALKKAINKHLRMQKVKTKYYKGEMHKEELEQYGWNQYQGNKILKTEMNDVLKTDDDLIDLEDKVHYLTTTVQMLESILKEINSRNYSLRTMVDWTKMMNGLN